MVGGRGQPAGGLRWTSRRDPASYCAVSRRPLPAPLPLPGTTSEPYIHERMGNRPGDQAPAMRPTGRGLRGDVCTEGAQAPWPFRAPAAPFSPQPIRSSEQCARRCSLGARSFSPASLISVNPLIVFADSRSRDISRDGLLH
jgi:hypothetical protein